MDLSLAIGLTHVVGGLVWAASILVLALILLVARRGGDAGPRALAEIAHLHRRVLRPAIAATAASGLVLAYWGGQLGEAWVILSAVLVGALLLTGPALVAPACRAGSARALPLAGIDLGAQALAVLLMVATPGWGGAAILAGLLACLGLALALLGESEARGAIPG